jgi:peptidoglycan-N-acetylglucosamine deacetylase
MNRRDFITKTALGAVILGRVKVSDLWAGDDIKIIPQISITIDDPNSYQTPLLTANKRNQAILNTLKNHSDLKAALFVCGERIDNPAGIRLLSAWDEQNHILGNHTYSHQYYHSQKIDADMYIEDILHCEKVIKDYKSFRKLFRYPYLKAGNMIEKRNKVWNFLKTNDYRHGYVTIDASDWYIDGRLKQRLKDDPDADLIPYRDFYLKHMLERASYYNDLSNKVMKRPIKHTLLIHHNLLNTLFLDELLSMFETNGWQLINASDAFDDPVFSLEPDIIPAGESIIWAAAKETGKFDETLRYPAEDGEYEKDEMDELGL